MANNISSDEELENKHSCRTYILTYSKADLSVVPNYADGEHQHYHMALKLSGTRRWRPVYQHIYKTRKISVNFSSKNYGYLAAYRYVCKDKPFESVLHSKNHPNLKNAKSPVSKRGFTRFSQNSKKRRCLEGPVQKPEASAKRRLSNSDVAKFCC